MTCDRAASRRLRNVERMIRNGDLNDALREVSDVIRIVEWLETERGVNCACAEATPSDASATL